MMTQRQRLSALAIPLSFVAAPVLAQQAPDLGEIAGTLTGQLSPAAVLVGVLSFVFGVMMTMTGLIKFKKGAESPNDPASRPAVGLMFIIVGSAMVALPSLIATGVVTIFGSGAQTVSASGGVFSFLP